MYPRMMQERTFLTYSVEKDTGMPSTRHPALDCSPGCPVEGTLNLIDGKWKGLIIYHLLAGTQRFSELRRRLASVTQRMLTNQLRELEADGLVLRKVFTQVPPRVEYSLSERGRSLEPVIAALKRWGDCHLVAGAEAAPAPGSGKAPGAPATLAG
jgi:DNA-binding HxlR family transcriptional regulator